MSFDSSKLSPLQQGSLDGLCGVYAVVSYFRRRLNLDEETDRAQLRRIFRIALENLNPVRELSVDLLLNGVRQGQLKRAFEAVAERLGVPVRAETISSHVKRAGTTCMFELVSTLGAGEAALVRLRDPNHWVLAFSGTRAQFWVDDSSYGGDRRAVRASLVEERQVEAKRGLVLLNA